MGIRHLLGYKVLGVPLYVIGLCGLVGMAVDVVDHPLAYYFPEVFDGRFLHTPLLVMALLVVFYYCARGGGLLIGLVLKKLKEVNGKIMVGIRILLPSKD